MMKINLKSLTEKEISAFIKDIGQPVYRARQIIKWLYERYAISFEEMTDLPKHLRELLDKNAYISSLKLMKREISMDGTQKFLFGLEDGEAVESVLIPDDDRLTLCISSQAGCAMRCRFCVTGSLGLKRDLMAYEIADQIITAGRLMAKKTIAEPPLALSEGSGDIKITNIVLMGMGEPLHNFAQVLEALSRMINLLGFSKRRITLSTAGIAPKIIELAKQAPRINLAVSLNATTDEIRNRLMPVNKKYPLKDLISVCRKFPLERARRITFEYILLGGVNDSKDDAQRLVHLLRGIRAKVNLIPFNKVTAGEKMEFRQSSENDIAVFQGILRNAGIPAFIRKSKGSDISAACGQLKAIYS
ncbi:MAG: 23S rRNA (adenine(2503)-C(2))-methyltransferase RlmN [Nitrospirae bacterium]|nr:23S rRNA (adenine(2503)-C(2))-methyltransferase RlmN [Nitrospirota bacterium]